MTDDEEPTIIGSPLSCRIEGDGTFIDVGIYQVEDEDGWSLEVVDEADAATVYDDLFDSDQKAFDEVMATNVKYGIRVYLENGLPEIENGSGTVH